MAEEGSGFREIVNRVLAGSASLCGSVELPARLNAFEGLV